MSGHVAVRQSVVSCLTAILAVDQRQRKEAEEELKALEVTEGNSHRWIVALRPRSAES